MRKSHVLAAILAVLALSAFADEKVTLKSGDVIIVHDDYTWEYLEAPAEPSELGLDLVMPKNASAVLKSSDGLYSIAYDPAVWKKTTGLNDAAELQLKTKAQDMFAMIIYEEIEMDVKEYADICYGYSEDYADDIYVDSEGYCTVNGIDGFMRVFIVEKSGMNFAFTAFYHTDDAGAWQIVAYTLLDKQEEKNQAILDVIAGFKLK